MIRRLLFIQIMLLIATIATAQGFGNLGNRFSGMSGNNRGANQNDSSKTEHETIPPKLYMWHLDENLGTVLKMPVDTANYNFQNTNLTEGMNGHYNYLGNLGSARLSRIFFERETNTSNFLLAPYSQFFVTPGNFKFTNSNVPYTNLSYYSGGGKQNGEERFKAYFSVNVNKHFAFGFNIDYLYGRGFYNNQNTAFFNGSLFASYMTDHYDASFIYSRNYLKMNENGGITDDHYITNPELMANGGKIYETLNIPTYLNASTNRNSEYYLYFTHRYKLGFTRKVKVVEVDNNDPLANADLKNKIKNNQVEQHKKPAQSATKPEPIDQKSPISQKGKTVMPPNKKMPTRPTPGAKVPNTVPKAKKDSIISEFVPITSFIHTVKFENSYHRFRSNDSVNYDKTYIKPSTPLINDTTQYSSIKNTFGIALLEGFNKYAKAGLTAYISHKLSQYKLMDADSTSIDKYNENEVFVGGELAKRQGKALHYVINGEFGLLDKAIGQFRVNGNIDLNFQLLSDTVSLVARANISNTLPDFYMRHYHSKHFYWDDDMNKEFRSRLEGELSIERLQTHLKFGIENIKNYTYFDSSAKPAQNSGNIQVMTATLSQNFRAGIFHLNNEVIWQKSSNTTIIPLPDLSLYHNLYIETKIAHKVLNLQLGADIRYFTTYYAPTYTPALQQFNLQKTASAIKLGGYPIINAYVNLQLKRTRFFAMFYHINQGSGNSMYFLVPHYPLNQRLFKIGISWNFYD
ncbi:MAG: hypothetical protein GX416_09935 [Bacteroidales bacterium]|nr:hypothetical protein [Bacteroidales bacterium]